MTANVDLDRGHRPASGHPAAHLEACEPVRLVLEALGQLGERPIVFPSMIPETESDSWTSEEMSAIDSWRSIEIFRRCSPTRRDIQTNTGSSASENARQPPVEQEERDNRRDHRRHRRDHRGRRRGENVVDPADVVRDPALDLAGPCLREEGQREPLQMLVDRRAQVVHHVAGRPRSRSRTAGPRAHPMTIEITIIPPVSRQSSPM